MSDIASRNLYELLGNDADQDPERREPPVPVKTVDKPLPRARRVVGAEPAQAASSDADATRGAGRGGRGGRGRGRGDYSGNERAFRDRDAGRTRNQDKPTEEGSRENRDGRPQRERGVGYEGRGRGRGRGGRGGNDDRHSRTVGGGIKDHAKQAAQGWGDETNADAELKDEVAGETIAKQEGAGGWGSAEPEPVNADEAPAPFEDNTAPVDSAPAEPEAEAEPEDKSKSYATYLAELAEKKLGLGGLLTARQANEGSSKQHPEGKALDRDVDHVDYFAGSGPKAGRVRERKEKATLALDHDIQAREREREGGGRGGRGGRGGFRGDREGGFRGDREGGRGRGEGRGRGGRGRGEGRGDYRGGENRGRGGRGGASQSGPNVTNDADFPSLGA